MTTVVKALSDSERRRLFAVVIPAASGKTTLAKELGKYKHKKGKKIQFIDIDEFASNKIKNIDEIIADTTHREIRLFPILRAEIYKILREYNDDSIVLITGNPKFVNFMEVKPKRTHIYIPTRDFSEELHKGFDEKEKSEVDASRENIIASYTKFYAMYETIDILVDLTTKAFDLILSDISPIPSVKAT